MSNVFIEASQVIDKKTKTKKESTAMKETRAGAVYTNMDGKNERCTGKKGE